MKTEDIPFFASIIGREIIFIRKELQGLPREKWTNVPVYQNYRFCNVHRCYDKTFRLIHKLDSMLQASQHKELHPGLRTVLRWSASNDMIEWLIDNLRNKTKVSSAILSANENCPGDLFKQILNAYYENKIKLVSGSFIVKRYGNDYEEMFLYYKAGTDFYYAFVDPFYKNGTQRSSKDAVKFFKDNAPWCADFGAYCIVSDWLYLEPELWNDKYEWTAYGPGAFRGINLILDTNKGNYLKHLQMLREEWLSHAQDMMNIICKETGFTESAIDNLCVDNGYLPMSMLLKYPLMLDVEHWLCEYAKYIRGWARKKY